MLAVRYALRTEDMEATYAAYACTQARIDPRTGFTNFLACCLLLDLDNGVQGVEIGAYASNKLCRVGLKT